ncbi:MAG TPA: UDP-N-acetylmuramate dehydrogenase [Pseudidiomarina sp.]|nr:UDP-N-acetylmuramate dehydrogenase [Pseudidiomarina sp.]
MIKTHFNVPLMSLHTFQLPSLGTEVRVIDDESDCAELPLDNYYILGEGSNTVFTENFSRPIVLNRIKGIDVRESATDWLVDVGAGENWHELVIYCLESNILGFENLALIPGTVGAAPVQNIGAYGREVSEYIESVRVWDRQVSQFDELANSDCYFGYRDSIFKRYPQRWLITSVRFRLPKAWRKEISYGELQALADQSVSALDIFNQVVAVRNRKLPDPTRSPNAGSFFKNPIISATHYRELKQVYGDLPGYPVDTDSIKVPAGWLIDRLGWKNKNCGNIIVHPQQALVLVNTKPGTGADLLSLAQTIIQSVKERFEIQLEVEVRLLGQTDLVEM